MARRTLKTAVPRTHDAPERMSSNDLRDRVLNPEHAAQPEAHEAVIGCEHPVEAWEIMAMRGLIPMEWIEHDHRWFTAHEPPRELLPSGKGVPQIDDVGRYLQQGPALESYPASIEACVAVASVPGGIVTAEALATEAVRRLVPWGCPLPPRVAWRCVRPAEWTSQSSDWRHMSVAHVVRDAYLCRRLPEMKDSLAAVLDFGTPVWRAAYAIECSRMWSALSERNAVVGASALKESAALGHPAVPRDMIGRAFNDLLDPFEPLVKLWLHGFALDAITRTSIVLVAPIL